MKRKAQDSPTPASAAAVPPLAPRIVSALTRRLRLVWMRLRFPAVRFGERCDIRAGFHLVSGPSSRISFGSRCILDRDMTVECSGRLTVGDRTIFGHHCTLGVTESLTIGPDCLIAELVSIRDHDHRIDGPAGVPIRQQGAVGAPVRIGSNVWLGAKVTVLRGVTIGDNSVVGANAVVTGDIPANAVAVGVPAKVIRYRE